MSLLEQSFKERVDNYNTLQKFEDENESASI